MAGTMRTVSGLSAPGRPEGRVLARLPHLAGRFLHHHRESRSRDYIENRIRAGLIEQWATDMLTETGVGDRMKREGLVHVWHQYRHQRRDPSSQFQGTSEQGHHHLRPAGGGEGSRGATAERWQPVDVRSRRHSGARHRHRQADDHFTAGRRRKTQRLRFHRRLRRLSRHLPAEFSGSAH